MPELNQKIGDNLNREPMHVSNDSSNGLGHGTLENNVSWNAVIGEKPIGTLAKYGFPKYDHENVHGNMESQDIRHKIGDNSGSERQGESQSVDHAVLTGDVVFWNNIRRREQQQQLQEQQQQRQQ
jgi:hypothetical protein